MRAQSRTWASAALMAARPLRSTLARARAAPPAAAAARRALSADAALPAVGSSGLDWSNIGFGFQETNGFVEFTWRNGEWGAGVFRAGAPS